MRDFTLILRSCKILPIHRVSKTFAKINKTQSGDLKRGFRDASTSNKYILNNCQVYNIILNKDVFDDS